MTAMNSNKKNRKKLIGLGALLLLLCMLSAPLHATQINVIGEKDTTIILFNGLQYMNEYSIQMSSHQFRKESSIRSANIVSTDKLFHFPLAYGKTNSFLPGKTLVIQPLISCKSNRKDFPVDKNRLLLSKRVLISSILKLPIG